MDCQLHPVKGPTLNGQFFLSKPGASLCSNAAKASALCLKSQFCPALLSLMRLQMCLLLVPNTTLCSKVSVYSLRCSLACFISDINCILYHIIHIQDNTTANTPPITNGVLLQQRGLFYSITTACPNNMFLNLPQNVICITAQFRLWVLSCITHPTKAS